MKRTVFFVSDSTALTIEALGNSLLTQFKHVEFEKITLPYINTIDKAKNALKTIESYCRNDCDNVLIFSSLVDADTRSIIANSHAVFMDYFDIFLPKLEEELHESSEKTIGFSHAVKDQSTYTSRIDAINFALMTDDGVGTKHYEAAEIILIGVSRSGKTPTCLYMALQFGILAANYPITEEDLQSNDLPALLKPYHSKLFGLIIQPERLHEIREQRKSNSRYSSLHQCQYELQHIESMMRRENIPYLNTTSFSIEEIATQIIQKIGIRRRTF